jgi:hypothetical protein
MKSVTSLRVWLLSSLLCAAAIGGAMGFDLEAPASYRTWKSTGGGKDVTTSQWVAPLLMSGSISDRIDLVVQTAFQNATNDQLGKARLSGMADTKAGLRIHVADGRLLLQTGVSAPTGPRDLDPDQLRVAFALAPPFLGYRIRQEGRGVDASAGASCAFPLSSRWSLGIGGGYVYQGSFSPGKGLRDVLPGPEYDLSAGIDGHLAAVAFRLDGTRRIFGEDHGGTGYKEPPSWDGSLQVSMLGGPWSADGAVLYSDKARPAGGAPLSGRYIGGLFAIQRMMARSVRIGLAGEIVHFGGLAQAGSPALRSLTTGLGPRAQILLGRSFKVDTRLLKLQGRLEDGTSSDLAGWDAQLTLSYSPPVIEP